MKDGPLGHLTRGRFEAASDLATSAADPVRARLVREALSRVVDELGGDPDGRHLAAFVVTTDASTLVRIAAYLKGI